MAISNSELAAKLQSVTDGWQAFVENWLDWQLSSADTITLEDPTTGNLRDIKTYHKIVSDYEDLLGDNPVRVQSLETQLTDLEGRATQVEQDLDTSETSLQSYLTDAQAARDAAQAAESGAQTAESNAELWAEQTVDTEVVPGGGQYSALHHASKAGDSASAAATSETNAANSASAAATSEANAATSETNAATSETNAAASESAAATSETNAAESETNAASSASAAATSETNAAASETKAGQWAEEAVGVEVETGKYSAKHHAEQAAQSASAAATSESEAASSASAAATSESNAANSESAAATSESNAATSESNAATSASNAATSETNAAASEQKAQDWAETEHGIEVEPGLYSAKHWAKQAQQNTSGISSTDDVAEGTNNLYFTDSRAVSAVQADASWNAGNWDLAYSWGNHTDAGYLTNVNWGDIGGSLADQTDLQNAIDAAGNDSTDELPEGTTNLYFTDARAVSAIQGDASWNGGNWDAAFSWGNHADAGYLKNGSSPSFDHIELGNHEIGDMSGDGSLWFDASEGVYHIAGNSQHTGPSLLWSHANVNAGANVSISYDSNDNPTVSVPSISWNDVSGKPTNLLDTNDLESNGGTIPEVHQDALWTGKQQFWGGVQIDGSQVEAFSAIHMSTTGYITLSSAGVRGGIYIVNILGQFQTTDVAGGILFCHSDNTIYVLSGHRLSVTSSPSLDNWGVVASNGDLLFYRNSSVTGIRFVKIIRIY